MMSAALGRPGPRLFFLALALALDLLFGLPLRPRDTGIRAIVGRSAPGSGHYQPGSAAARMRFRGWPTGSGRVGSAGTVPVA